MQTYHSQGTEGIDKGIAETILGIVVLIVLVACGLASVPLPSRVTAEQPSVSLRRDQLRAAEIQQLRDQNSSLQNELKKLSRALDNTKEDLASFRQVHDALIAQVATATAKMQDVENRIQDSKSQAKKLNEYASQQEKLKSEYASAEEQLKRERDEAVEQASKAAEQIRQLTLRLQRANLLP